MDLYFLDTETTGFGQCRLVEIAYQKNDEPIKTFRVRPPIPIQPGATETHGISNEDVAGLPLFQDLPEYPHLKALLENGVIIAHSASFDLEVLAREGINCELWICTKRVARHVYPHAPNHKLQGLRQYLQLDSDGKAHSADGDVSVLRSLFESLKATMLMNGTAEDDVLSEMARA